MNSGGNVSPAEGGQAPRVQPAYERFVQPDDAMIVRDAIVATRLRPGPLQAGGPLRTHATACLGIYLGGRATVELQGHWSLETGDVLVVPAGQPHRPLSVQRADIWGIGLSLEPRVSSEDLLDPFERVRDGYAPVVRIGADRQTSLEALVREVRVAVGHPSPSAATVRSLLALAIDEVTRGAWSSPPEDRGRHSVAESLHYIERHCLEPLPLERLGRELGRSPAYLTTALKRATGRSAGSWIAVGRMAEARRRLRYSTDAVATIARHVGYADTTHFIRLFRRAHGATPSIWRRRAREQGLAAWKPSASADL